MLDVLLFGAGISVVVVVVVGVLVYLLRDKETPYVEIDDFDQIDGASKKTKKRRNGDRKPKKSPSSQDELSGSRETSGPESKLSEPVSSVLSSSPKPTASKKSATKEQPTKPVAKSVEKQQAKPAEKSVKADVTDGAAASLLPTRSPKAAAKPAEVLPKSKSPTPAPATASKAADISPKPEKVKKSPAPQSKPKAVQSAPNPQQKSKPKKKAGVVDGLREQLEELDLSQSDCLDLVRLFQERADQQGSWTTKGSKGPAESVTSLKTRCDQLVEELESTRSAHTQHLHQLSSKRVELQEESKRLRIQCTELQTLVVKKDTDIKQFVSRVRQLEEDAKSASPAAPASSSNSSTLVEENTVLKMELSHLKSQMKETHVNGPTETGNLSSVDSSKEVASLQREVAQLKKSLEKERNARKSGADSAASNAKLQAAEQENRRLAKRIAELEAAPVANSSADDDIVESLENERDNWRAQAQERGAVLEDMNVLLGKLQNDYQAEEQSNRAALEQKAAAVKKAQAELECVRSELKAAQNSLAGHDQEVAGLRDSLRTATESSETLEKDLSRLREQNSTLESQVSELRATNSTLSRAADSSEV